MPNEVKRDTRWLSPKEREEFLSDGCQHDPLTCKCRLAYFYRHAQLVDERITSLEAERDSALARNQVLETALQSIRDEKPKWTANVGSYAGGETDSGFFQRLQRIAREALTHQPEQAK